jgi:HD superfamily phosphohydrolase
MSYKRQRIRDPLHNLVEFPDDHFHDAIWRVIQTSHFQRLRRIKQLGFSELVYPGATHSRFAHSLGVFHTARKLMEVVERHLGRASWDATQSHIALAAALVHDLGHGPYSHAFEDVGRKLNLSLAKHEKVTEQLIRDVELSEALKPLGSGFASDVADVIANPSSARIYGAVVSSQFDADRLDYMQRDRLMTGTYHGVIDFDWLLSNLEVGKVSVGSDEEQAGEIETFVLGPKALHAAETYLLGLFQLYATVYFHKATRGAEKLFTELLTTVIVLTRDGHGANTGLGEKHPILRFALHPEDLSCTLALDDAVIAGSLVMMSDSTDPVISDFSSRLRNRRLFKCIDVRESINQKLREKSGKVEKPKAAKRGTAAMEAGKSTAVEMKRIGALDRTCDATEKRLLELAQEMNLECPRMLLDKGERSMYKPIEESKGPLNQIMIFPTSANDLPVDVASISQVINAIAPFKFLRVYMGDSEHKTKQKIDEIIDEEAKKCRL